MKRWGLGCFAHAALIASGCALGAHHGRVHCDLTLCVTTHCRMIGFTRFSLCFSKITIMGWSVCDSGATWPDNAPSAHNDRVPGDQQPNNWGQNTTERMPVYSLRLYHAFSGT